MSQNQYHIVQVDLLELSAGPSEYLRSLKRGGRLILKVTASGDSARAQKTIIPPKGVFLPPPGKGKLNVKVEARLFEGLVADGESLTVYLGIQDAAKEGSPPISHIATLSGNPAKWKGKLTLRALNVVEKADPAVIELAVTIASKATKERPKGDRGEHVDHKRLYKEFMQSKYGKPLSAEALRKEVNSLSDQASQIASVVPPNEAVLAKAKSRALLMVNEKSQTVKEAKHPDPKGSFGYASQAYEVPALKEGQFADLMLPLSNLKEVQRDKIHVFRWDTEMKRWTMEQFSGAHPMLDVAWARISSPGIYVAVGLTLNPYKRETIKLFAHYRTMIEGARALGNEVWINNLCRFILCGPDMMGGVMIDDGMGGFVFPDLPGDPEQARDQMNEFRQNPIDGGLGFPRPGTGNICDECFGMPFPERLPDIEILQPPFLPYLPYFPLPRTIYIPCDRWNSLGPTFPTCVVRDIAIHPDNSRILFAAAASGGLWRTTNGGSAWSPLTDRLPNLNAKAVAVSRTAPAAGTSRTVYFGTEPNAMGNDFDLYASDDNGLNWELRTAVPSNDAWEIATGGSNAQLVYLAGDRSLHKSIDGGRTWIVQNVTVDGVAKANVRGIFDGIVWDIKLDPGNDNRFYIAVSGVGILRSDDGGATYTNISVGLAGFTGGARILLDVGNDTRPGKHGTSFIVAKADQSIAFSTNRGGGWTTHPAGVELGGTTQGGWCSSLAICPSNQDYFVAGGFWASQTLNGTNAAPAWAFVPGRSWVPWDSPERVDEYHPDIQTIRFDPNDPTRFYICNDGGITRVDGNGANALRISDGLNANVLFYMDISQGGTFHTGSSSYHVGILRKQPGSSTIWKYVEIAEGGIYRIDPRDSTLHFCDPWGSALKRSTSSGDQGSWAGVVIDTGGAGEAYVYQLEFRPSGADVIWCASFFDRIHHSSDHGQTWVALANAAGAHLLMDGTGGDRNGATCFTFAPSNSDVLYVGTTSGRIWRTLTGALNSEGWAQAPSLPLPQGTAQINAIAIHPTDPNTVIVGYSRSGANQIFRTRDAGVTWTPMVGVGAGTFGRLPQLPAVGIVIDPNNPRHIVVALQFGVYVTYDGGGWWQPYSDGLPSVTISELRYRRANRKLYICTGGRGVFHRYL